MSDAFLGRQAIQLGILLGRKIPGMPSADTTSVMARLVKVPENSLLGQLLAMRDVGRSEQVISIPLPPPRVAPPPPPDAPIAIKLELENHIELRDVIVGMTRRDRATLRNMLNESLTEDEAVA